MRHLKTILLNCCILLNEYSLLKESWYLYQTTCRKNRLESLLASNLTDFIHGMTNSIGYWRTTLHSWWNRKQGLLYRQASTTKQNRAQGQRKRTSFFLFKDWGIFSQVGFLRGNNLPHRVPLVIKQMLLERAPAVEPGSVEQKLHPACARWLLVHSSCLFLQGLRTHCRE